MPSQPKNRLHSLQVQLRHAGVILFFGSSIATAGEATHWAEIAQNPLADCIKLPVENRFDAEYGHKDAVNYRLSFKPSMVSKTSGGWNIVNRLDVPLIYQPGRVPGESDSWGLGDITYDSFYGPSNGRNFFWGIGPALQLPTATDNQLGTKKWSAGMAGALSIVHGPFVLGTRLNHLWSFAGKDHRDDVNRTSIEYFIYANLRNGWWIGTSPINTADWGASSGETWTIPVGGGIGKLVGKRRPLNIKLEAYTYAEAPKNYTDWSCMVSFEFLIPENSLFKR